MQFQTQEEQTEHQPAQQEATGKEEPQQHGEGELSLGDEIGELHQLAILLTDGEGQYKHEHQWDEGQDTLHKISLSVANERLIILKITGRL